MMNRDVAIHHLCDFVMKMHAPLKQAAALYGVMHEQPIEDIHLLL